MTVADVDLVRPVVAATLGFAGATLDRMDPLRGDPVRLAAAFADPAARLLILDGLSPVIEAGRLATAPVPADAAVEDYTLLGTDAAGPLFVAVRKQSLPHGADRMPGLWELQQQLDADELARYGAARALVDWHARHGFCAACGGMTAPVRAGWSRKCGQCNAEHFPRVDPVVIMLAEHEGRVLVGRQARFAAGQYSALAGFVEPGETVEEAVSRELWEEAGVRTTAVRYVMSQPWPFPSSLMIACIAPVESGEITLDTTELEDAMWVDKAGVRAGLARAEGAPFLAPFPVAIAHHLLRAWVEE
ncbi:NAD(+) diphosphatase [Sphingobium sufflavum]|uniref:NAD(+) diphosphatase n=1 Tax=Sphingobium sufflavum TaxID=1129547 RepID=UPI001F44CCF7|nr:NAD(+) diphosphatase [Sphingobium sufflavum]MCE7795323.1 NAD(+) diphosphatase [Sphingobium sufflavum]